MATASDIINNSLELLGVLAPGESASASQITSGLRSLNRMLGSWSTENLMMVGETTENFDLISGQQTYTMGPSGDFDTIRAMEIINITWRDESQSPALELPIEIVPQEMWKYEENKATSSNIPTKLYINYGQVLNTLNFWPNPSEARKVSITSNKPLTQYSSPSTPIALYPGWEEALEYNLALRLQPSYGIGLDPMIYKIAVKSKGNLKRQNIKPVRIGSEVAQVVSSGKTFDYRTGY